MLGEGGILTLLFPFEGKILSISTGSGVSFLISCTSIVDFCSLFCNRRLMSLIDLSMYGSKTKSILEESLLKMLPNLGFA